jgi:choline monooxygenase
MTQTSNPHLSPDAPDVAAPAPARSPGHSAVGGALAHGLPTQAYVGEANFALENERLFANAWVFAGFAHELSATGDVVPVTVAGAPLLLVRGRDGAIRAFHNVCRHRCALLVDAPGNVGRVITCPYHAWAYGLDGSLRATPHFAGPDRHDHPGLDRRQMGLKPVRSAVWQDWIFVNVSGTAAEFEAFIAPIARRLEDLNLTQMTPVATIDMGEVRTNWKFLMENFIEPYHVQYVHKTTTEQPLSDHSTFIDGHCLGSAVEISAKANGTGHDGGHDGGRGGPCGGKTLAVDSWYLTLFPNFVLGRYHPDQIGVHLNVPLAAGRTRQRRVIYHTGEGALDAETVDGLAKLWRKVHEEDHEICERLQRGRASEVAGDGGVLSPHWEDSLQRFQDLVRAAVS